MKTKHAVSSNRTAQFMTYLLAAMLVMASLLSTSEVRAAPLGLTGGDPDISAANITITYDATSQLFTAFGAATQIRNGGTNTDLAGTMTFFQVNAQIDNMGNLSGPGSILIQEMDGSPTYISGVLNNFGYTVMSPPVFEFTFDADGGDLAAAFSNGGNIILAAGVTGTGDYDLNKFTQDFSFSSSGSSADTFASSAPTPGGLALMGLGLGLLKLRRAQRG